jgi:hypothetical protein
MGGDFSFLFVGPLKKSCTMGNRKTNLRAVLLLAYSLTAHAFVNPIGTKPMLPAGFKLVSQARILLKSRIYLAE